MSYLKVNCKLKCSVTLLKNELTDVANEMLSEHNEVICVGRGEGKGDILVTSHILRIRVPRSDDSMTI
jgi:hypothetical protein